MGNTTSSVQQIIKDTIDYSPIEHKQLNPIVPIDYRNDSKIVDKLLEICSDIIDSRYKPWFAKRFYAVDKDSVLRAASIARKEGKNPQKHFADMVKTV